MATEKKFTVNDGFVRGTEAGVYATIGAVVHAQVSMKVQARTASDVYSQLVKQKSQFSDKTWEKIEKAHVKGEIVFFYDLFDILAGGHYDWKNKKTTKEIIQSNESQAISKAFHDSVTSEVSCMIKTII